MQGTAPRPAATSTPDDRVGEPTRGKSDPTLSNLIVLWRERRGARTGASAGSGGGTSAAAARELVRRFVRAGDRVALAGPLTRELREASLDVAHMPADGDREHGLTAL